MKFYRVLLVSDVHYSLGNVKRANSVERELTIVAGDLSYCGSLEEALEVLERFSSETEVVWVPGNCDSPRLAEVEKPGINVHGRLRVVDGIAFAGVGGGLISPFNTPFEMRDEEHEAVLRRGLEAYNGSEPLVIVSHNPPYMSGLDVVRGGVYVGAKGLRRVLAEYRPLVLASGHIHESWGISIVEGVLAVNPGPLRDKRYAVLHLDLENSVSRARLYKL